MKLKKLKGVIKKMLKEVISEQQLFDFSVYNQTTGDYIRPPYFSNPEHLDHVSVTCPPGYVFIGTLPSSGKPSPRLVNQTVQISYCVSKDIPKGPFGKPGTEGGELKPPNDAVSAKKPKSGI